MTALPQTRSSPSIAFHNRITLTLILALLVLRLPFFTLCGTFLGDVPNWVSPAYELGTYLLTTILLVWELDVLPDYHINPLALWMIILFKPLETIYLTFWYQVDTPLTLQSWPGISIWVVALVEVVSLAYPMSLQIDRVDPMGKNQVFGVLLSGATAIPYQIGSAAVNEEPLFRGFLWGYLRKVGWQNKWIWLFQAGLFTLGHFYYITKAPISFWLIVPTGALVLGWLAWRSRSIATSMLGHGVINPLGHTLGYLVAAFRLYAP